MSRGRSLAISLAAAVLSLIVVYGIYMLLIRQVELQQTVQVAVPRNFIPAGSFIRRDMLEYITVAEAGVSSGMVMNADEITGLVALIPLGKHEPVLSWKLDAFHLLPTAGQATFSVPREYILSVPGAIRAGDRVILYASGAQGTIRLLPDEVVVASVKSSSNTEVDNPLQSNVSGRLQDNKEMLYLSRRDANAAVEQINLNLTEEEWRVVDDACRSGASRLVIAILAASISEEGGEQ